MKRIRIEIAQRFSEGHEHKLQEGVRQFLRLSVENLRVRKLYWLDIPPQLPWEQVKQASEQVLCDPLLEDLVVGSETHETRPCYVVQVSFRPGVTDNAGKVATEAMELVGLKGVKVSSGQLYLFNIRGQATGDDIGKMTREFLANELVHQIDIKTGEEFHRWDRFAVMDLAGSGERDNQDLQEKHPLQVQKVPLEEGKAGLRKLLALSEEKGWALSEGELEHIRHHFAQGSVKQAREEVGLPPHPTDVEMEIIAQTWSEHCKHKIFRATIDYSEEEGGELVKGEEQLYPKLGASQVRQLFKTYIQGATQRVVQERGIDWTMSLFSDNAGIVRFDEKLDLCIKVETHNSPSALDPYGGALTGILGVNRDILGCGLGARPVANTNIFCLCSPLTPTLEERDLWPPGLKHPRQILQGVHHGVADGGNKSGIPTVNGSLVFDDDFAGKPLIYCGTLGVIPHEVGPVGDKRESWKKTLQVGDRIVVVGGAVGKDGIHGATLSSLEMNESTPATMVQIGDPLTQKRVLDFVLEARDLGLYRSLTDNGAGGLSSSVGEMAQMTGGAEMDLIHCPLKYPGLVPYEIMVSESQERMTLGVPEEKLAAFQELAQRRGVQMAVLGEFTSSGHLSVFYGGERVAHLDLEFLHESLPPMQLQARWQGPQRGEVAQGVWRREDPRLNIPRDQWQRPSSALAVAVADNLIAKLLLRLLSSPNICSKESLVRQYDHEVQASTHIKPFVGPQGHGPADAAVVAMGPHGGEERRGVALGHGLCPKLSRYDAYLMAQYAVDEAMRNVVASGGNPLKTCLVDNFCWPDPILSAKNPDGPHKLAQLVRACRGLYDSVVQLGAPLVSGKDSMKNDYMGRDGKGRPVKISVPPTLLITAVSDVEDLSHTVSMEVKEAGDLIYSLGVEEGSLGGSELMLQCRWEEEGSVDLRPSGINLQDNLRLYEKIHEMMKKGLLHSAHDISDGGLLVALAESLIGGERGAQLVLPREWMGRTQGELVTLLFHEAPGRFVVTVPAEQKEAFEGQMQGLPHRYLGVVTEEKSLVITSGQTLEKNGRGDLCSLPLKELQKSWRSMW